MLKNFRDLYLIGISFIAGVLFVVQCGGTVQSIAQAVTEALGIGYSNTDSGLEATTVQAAIDEIVSTLPSVPRVYDATGTEIGLYVASLGDDWEIWDPEKKAPFVVEASSGEVVAGSAGITLFFESEDCSGTSYIILTSYKYYDYSNIGTSVARPVFINEKLYWYVFGGSTKSINEMHSSIEDGSSTCSTVALSSLVRAITTGDELDPVFVEVEVIEEPNYQGPLFIH